MLETQQSMDGMAARFKAEYDANLQDAEAELDTSLAQVQKIAEQEKKERQRQVDADKAAFMKEVEEERKKEREELRNATQRFSKDIADKEDHVTQRDKQMDNEMAAFVGSKEREVEREKKAAKKKHEEEEVRWKKEKEKLQVEVDELKKSMQEATSTLQAQLLQRTQQIRNMLKNYTKEGKILPMHSWKDINTACPKQRESVITKRAVALLPVLSQLGGCLEETNKALELINPDYQGNKFAKAATQAQLEKMREEQMSKSIHEMAAMRQFTVAKVKEVIGVINEQMDPNCEADIKIIAGTSDELLEYCRDRRFKDMAPDGKSTLKRIQVYDDMEVDSVLSCSKRQRVKKLKERAKPFDITPNENGTIATLPILDGCARATRYAEARLNSLVQPPEPEFYLFSGDALQTGKGENSTICAVRSAELKEGWSSSYNFMPVSNCLGKDDHPDLVAALGTQRPTVNTAILSQDFNGRAADMGVTGDLTFLLSFYGMGSVSSTYGNPWVGLPNANGEREDVDSSGNPRWKQLKDFYLLSHEKPPDHSFERDRPIKCPAKRCKDKFEASCQEDIDKDRERCSKMTKPQISDWTKRHLNNCPHQAPLFHIDPKNCFPGMYHFAENLMDHRWKHCIWDACGQDNEKKYKVNAIMALEIGYAHVPKNMGDEVYCMSFIGQDVNNFRASTTLMRVLNVLYPEDMKRLQAVYGL